MALLAIASAPFLVGLASSLYIRGKTSEERKVLAINKPLAIKTVYETRHRLPGIRFYTDIFTSGQILSATLNVEKTIRGEVLSQESNGNGIVWLVRRPVTASLSSVSLFLRFPGYDRRHLLSTVTRSASRQSDNVDLAGNEIFTLFSREKVLEALEKNTTPVVISGNPLMWNRVTYDMDGILTVVSGNHTLPFMFLNGTEIVDIPSSAEKLYETLMDTPLAREQHERLPDPLGLCYSLEPSVKESDRNAHLAVLLGLAGSATILFVGAVIN